MRYFWVLAVILVGCSNGMNPVVPQQPTPEAVTADSVIVEMDDWTIWAEYRPCDRPIQEHFVADSVATFHFATTSCDSSSYHIAAVSSEFTIPDGYDDIWVSARLVGTSPDSSAKFEGSIALWTATSTLDSLPFSLVGAATSRTVSAGFLANDVGLMSLVFVGDVTPRSVGIGGEPRCLGRMDLEVRVEVTARKRVARL